MFQGALFFAGFIALYIQGAYSKCASVTMLAMLCIGSALLCVAIQGVPNWVRTIAGFSMLTAFGIQAYSAAELFAIYGGQVAEYRFVAITAVVLMCVAAPAIVPLPKRQKQPAAT